MSGIIFLFQLIFFVGLALSFCWVMYQILTYKLEYMPETKKYFSKFDYATFDDFKKEVNDRYNEWDLQTTWDDKKYYYTRHGDRNYIKSDKIGFDDKGMILSLFDYIMAQRYMKKIYEKREKEKVANKKDDIWGD